MSAYLCQGWSVSLRHFGYRQGREVEILENETLKGEIVRDGGQATSKVLVNDPSKLSYQGPEDLRVTCQVQ